MKQKIIFFEHYLPEILFVFSSVLTIAVAIYCVPLVKNLSAIMVLAAAVIQMIFTEILKSKYPQKNFKTLCFAYIFLFSAIIMVLSLCEGNIYTLLGVTLVLMGALLDRYRRDKVSIEFEEKYPFSRDIDVLCETDDDRKVRLPFKKRFLGNPIGIFPFKNEPEYIKLKEFFDKTDMNNNHIGGDSFPDTDFCNRIAENLEQLNLCLQELEAPILSGDYYAENSLMKGLGMVVSFKKGNIDITRFEGQENVKFRMIGKFYGESKNLK